MNKKGFTLTELLGVIVLLVLITMITIPIISNAIKNGKETADKQTEENIVLAARNWAADNKQVLVDNAKPTYKVSIQTLKDGGYIDRDIKLPSTDEEITNTCVEIKDITSSEAIKKQYTYTYSKNCS